MLTIDIAVIFFSATPWVSVIMVEQFAYLLNQSFLC